MKAALDHRHRIKHDLDVARKYVHRKKRKHAREMQMIEHGMALTSGVMSVLDAPCGVGRATIWLATNGYEPTGIDLGSGAVEVALEQARSANVEVAIEQADILNMRFGDRSFDAVLCFRLLHHFPTAEIRAQFISTLSRVAGKYVLISYISPYSVTSIRRKIKRRLLGVPITQHSTTIDEISSSFKREGFDLLHDLGGGMGHSLRLAVFQRRG